MFVSFCVVTSSWLGRDLASKDSWQISTKFRKCNREEKLSIKLKTQWTTKHLLIENCKR